MPMPTTCSALVPGGAADRRARRRYGSAQPRCGGPVGGGLWWERRACPGAAIGRGDGWGVEASVGAARGAGRPGTVPRECAGELRAGRPVHRRPRRPTWTKSSARCRWRRARSRSSSAPTARACPGWSASTATQSSRSLSTGPSPWTPRSLLGSPCTRCASPDQLQVHLGRGLALAAGPASAWCRIRRLFASDGLARRRGTRPGTAPAGR